MNPEALKTTRETLYLVQTFPTLMTEDSLKSFEITRVKSLKNSGLVSASLLGFSLTALP